MCHFVRGFPRLQLAAPPFTELLLCTSSELPTYLPTYLLTMIRLVSWVGFLGLVFGHIFWVVSWSPTSPTILGRVLHIHYQFVQPLQILNFFMSYGTLCVFMGSRKISCEKHFSTVHMTVHRNILGGKLGHTVTLCIVLSWGGLWLGVARNWW